MRIRHVIATLGAAAVLVSSSAALANHNHPSKSNKFLSLFVQAYNQCTSPTLTHKPPLAFPACVPVQTGSLTFGAKGFGQATGVVKLNGSKQATDVQLVSKFADIRTGTQTGALFTGNLTVSATIRSTDHFCTTPGECTLIDVPFPVGVPCSAGKCGAKTSANGVVANAVQPGNEANVEITQLQVFNGAELEFTEGLWLP